MTEIEQNMVNRLKMIIARKILDLDDEKILEIINTAIKRESENE